MNELPCTADPEAMFPISAHNANLDQIERQVTRDICGMCPTNVKAACLEFILNAEAKETHSFGVAGGLTANQRRKLINAEKAKAAKPRADKAECGTVSGFSVHRRKHTPICGPCREAANQYTREYRAARKEMTA